MDGDTVLTLSEWVHQEHDIIEDFRSDYSLSNKSNPKDFPLKLTALEWDELFTEFHHGCEEDEQAK